MHKLLVDEIELRTSEGVKMVDETERKVVQQLGTVTALANSGLDRLNRTKKMSQEEMNIED
jgi:hypothetical protein